MCDSVKRLGVVCLLIQNSYRIVVGGKTWNFELPFGCGLGVIGKKGEEIKAPPERHPFWRAVELWVEQRQRMTLAGECVWVDKPKPRVKHLGGRNYLVLETVTWSAEEERYVVAEVPASGS